jgi:uncharacterized protein DUF6895
VVPAAMPVWSTEDLVRRVDRALDIADGAIGLISSNELRIDLAALEAAPDKICAEVAMFLRAVAAIERESASGLRDRADSLARRLAPVARRPQVVIGLALHPALARDYAAAHSVLTVMGYADPGFDRILHASLDAPSANARERLPHRELEQEWLASLSGTSTLVPTAVGRTALFNGVDLLTGARDDIYALTHALFYVADFGLRPAAPLPTDLIEVARSALAGALDDDDFDLAGELLLAWPLTKTDWGPVESFAFAVLAAVEDGVGLLPSLALDGAAFSRHEGESRRQYVTASAYHTAIVMGLLCASLLRTSKLPSAAAGAAQRATPFPMGPSLLADLAKTHAQWITYAQGLTTGRVDEIAQLLVDVGLRRAIRRFDLESLRRISSGQRKARFTSRSCRHSKDLGTGRGAAGGNCRTEQSSRPLRTDHSWSRIVRRSASVARSRSSVTERSAA